MAILKLSGTVPVKKELLIKDSICGLTKYFLKEWHDVKGTLGRLHFISGRRLSEKNYNLGY